MPGLAGGIARDIRDGTLKKYLLQPIDMIGYLLAYRVAHKVAYIVTSALPYAVLFFLCRASSTACPTRRRSPPTSSSLLLAFLIGFFFEACIGMIGFWFLEVTSLLYIVNTLNFFISGHMFPLDLLPPRRGRRLLEGAAVPVPGLLPGGGLPGQGPGRRAVCTGCWPRSAWAVALIVLARLLYRLGLRRYSAFGG